MGHCSEMNSGAIYCGLHAVMNTIELNDIPMQLTILLNTPVFVRLLSQSQFKFASFYESLM